MLFCWYLEKVNSIYTVTSLVLEQKLELENVNSLYTVTSLDDALTLVWSFLRRWQGVRRRQRWCLIGRWL